ncbi:hypothetical protein OIPHN330_16240 [Citrobacter freundii]|uniref:hypothetical protein n=1 Tax=Citrobacter freundii TaxID=546 RepID=UPI001904768C|nr:hypothetical protein [Citrobacter freundii]EJD6095888.1 hypothetical protein [Citrobacter freundii]EKX9189930.1 hypothetical protein [Citrobacter freundii]MBJ8813356.1 hypothetical protein [Citrobacter freundii]BEJ33004.1 hypothetical protein OIPHN330_16240 [Citrobacter freundii]BEJ38910.1 hypothetical protein OIPHN354_16220 [Citrobacter freundii]
MAVNLITWIVSTITSAGFLAGVAYLMRDVLTRFLTKSIEHKFEKKIEEFRAEIRSEEKELEQIRAFIVSARRERDGGLQSKRFEAAEMLLANRKFLLEFSGLVDIVKMIKFDELLKQHDKNKVKDLIDTLLKPYNIDKKLEEYKKYDYSIPKLYLNERVIAFFEVYKQIVMYAVTTMTLISVGAYQNSDDLKSENLVKAVQALVPLSKEGFDKHGDMYALHWFNYFYDGILSELRNDLFGSDTMDKDTELAVRLLVDANNAQVKVRTAFNKYGLPEQLLKQ